MKDYSSERLARMGRRRFVKTLAGLGMSATTLQYMTQDALAQTTDNPKEEVPYVARWVHTNDEQVKQAGATVPPKRKPVYETVPRAKWVRVKAAHKAALKLDEVLSRITKTNMVKPAVTTLSDGQKAIQVTYIKQIRKTPDEKIVFEPKVPLNRIEDTLPAYTSATVGEGQEKTTVGKIPVLFDTERKVELVNYDDKYRPVAGGCRYGIEAWPGSEVPCTLGVRAYNNEANEYQMVTAGHCFYASGGSDQVHQPGDNATDSNLIGEPDNLEFRRDGSDLHFDAASITLYDDIYASGYLAENGGNYSRYADATVSWDTLSMHEGDSDWSVSKQGIATGVQSGYIDSLIPSDNEVKITANGAGGDSGGPIYHTRDDGTIDMVSITSKGSGTVNDDNEYPYVHGNAMSYIENQFNLTV